MSKSNVILFVVVLIAIAVGAGLIVQNRRVARLEAYHPTAVCDLCGQEWDADKCKSIMIVSPDDNPRWQERIICKSCIRGIKGQFGFVDAPTEEMEWSDSLNAWTITQTYRVKSWPKGGGK